MVNVAVVVEYFLITRSAPEPVAPSLANTEPVGRGVVSLLLQLGYAAKSP